MSLPAYKVCAVPFCTSTTIKTPEKLFIHGPQKLEIRKKWLQLAGRHHTTVSPKYSMYFCEDHFDLPKDMENYMELKVMGSVGKIRMKPYCLPSKFVCQQDQRKRVSTSMSTSPLTKKQKTTLTCNLEATEIEDLGVPRTSGTSNLDQSSQLKCTSDSSDREAKNEFQLEVPEIRFKNTKEESSQIAYQNTLRLIKKNPRFYIGVSEDCLYLVDIIKKYLQIPECNIFLCLQKIRLDKTFLELGDIFGISMSCASKIFKKCTPTIAGILSHFIVKSKTVFVKHQLPVALRHKYNKIDCIIDCLEIEIQKPSNAVHWALTWSDYKKANTAKYLISSTPDGIINYISPGFTGRISDVALVENCDFFNYLEPGSYVLADRGFKHIEPLLLQKGFHLVRPSVSSTSKITKAGAQKTKEKSSRFHIERVIRRLREFSMLKPHSVVNSNLITYLDECVVIACALINIQGSN